MFVVFFDFAKVLLSGGSGWVFAAELEKIGAELFFGAVDWIFLRTFAF